MIFRVCYPDSGTQRARNCAFASCVRLLSRVPVWNHPRPSLSLSLAVWRNKMRKGKKEKRKSGLYPRVNRRRNIRSTFSAASEERREEKRYFFSPFQKCICTMLPAHSPPPIWGYSHRFSHTPPTGFAKRDKGLPSKKRDSNVAAPAQGFLGDLPPEHRSYAVHISLM